MQRWLSIAFLALFGYALVGIYPVQFALREMARHDMKAFIQDGGAQRSGLTDLSFVLKNGAVADAGFSWEEEDEFSFDGAMYDVVGREVKDGIVTFHCISDEHETRSVGQAKAIDRINGAGQAPPRDGKTLVKFVSEKYINGKDARTTDPEVRDRRFLPLLNAIVSHGHVRRSSPPPRG